VLEPVIVLQCLSIRPRKTSLRTKLYKVIYLSFSETCLILKLPYLAWQSGLSGRATFLASMSSNPSTVEKQNKNFHIKQVIFHIHFQPSPYANMCLKSCNQLGARSSHCNPRYWEAKIWRIAVPGQPWQIVHETPFSKIIRVKWTGDGFSTCFASSKP
jgi:hypothetical protein